MVVRAVLRRARWLYPVVLLTFLLAGCRPGQAPSPTPARPTPTPPRLLRLARPPDLALWDERLWACAREVAQPIAIHETTWDALAQTQADGVLTWGDQPAQPTWPTYEIGRLGAMAIVHMSRRAETLHTERIQAIYQARPVASPAWQPLLPLPGHPVYRALEGLVAPFPWNPKALWSPDPQWAVGYVERNRQALGWVPWGWPLPKSVVGRTVPGPLARRWPVLLSLKAADPKAQAWVACLQRGEAQP